MGERGPKSTVNKLTVLKHKPRRWPNPAPGMTANARTTWHRIVRSYDPDHFKPHQYDLLRAFCEASASHRRAILEMKKSGEVILTPIGGLKKSPWKDIEVQMNSSMTSLSTKLGLSVNATIAARGIKGNTPKPKSKREGLLGGKI